MRSPLVLCLLLGVLAPASAAEPAAPSAASPDDEGETVLDTVNEWTGANLTLRDVTVYWENDGTVPALLENSDRFYTNGLGLEVSLNPNLSPDLRERFAPSSAWDDPRFGVGVALKQLIFTAEDISDPNPPPDDHPYGGFLYFSFSFQRADARKHDHFEVNLGVVGDLSGAETLQKFIHDVFPDEENPQGWDTQLDNEVGLNFGYQRTWKSERADVRGLEMELLPSVRLDAGNVWTRARAQMTLRAGLGLPDDFGPASLLGKKDHTVGGADWGERDLSFYAYTGISVDAVVRDIFLDGNSFEDSRSTDSEPLVAEWVVGAVLRYRSCYFGWAQTFQTETFEAQPDGQSWGSITLGASFNF